MIKTSAFKIASKFIGTHEIAGSVSNPQILAMLRLVDSTAGADEIAWCSAFINYIAWLLGLPMSKSLAARSWLKVGTVITLDQAQVDCDIVILSRGFGEQPGPEVIAAPGHVGFYAGMKDGMVLLLAGNQGNSISIQPFNQAHILGVRRIA
jgi:uncharacterized protein (TIGR02594 family)